MLTRGSTTTARPGGRSAVDVPASVAGAAAGLLTAVAIYFGSRGLRTFDAALVGYATATIFLSFGVVYRYVLWVQSPPAMRYLRRGWGSFLSLHNFRRFPTLVPRALVSNLALQTFIARRSPGFGIMYTMLAGDGNWALAFAWGTFVWLGMMVVMPIMMPQVEFPSWFPLWPLLAHLVMAVPIGAVALAWVSQSDANAASLLRHF